MVSGIALTLGYIIYFQFVLKIPDGKSIEDFYVLGISPEGIGFIGMIVNFVVATAVSSVTAPPPSEIVDMNRRNPCAPKCRWSDSLVATWVTTIAVSMPDAYPAQDTFQARKSMKIVVSGASGLVGSEVMDRLRSEGHEAVALVRKEGAAGIYWKPSEGKIDSAALEGCDAVIHLAGENIAEGRWNDAKKKRITDSRIVGTSCWRKLCQAYRTSPRFLCRRRRLVITEIALT